MDIIKSLLNTDFYKLTMGQVALHQFPWVNVKYEFKCRNKKLVFSEEQMSKLMYGIAHFCALEFTEDELNYLSNIRFFKPSYIDFLRLYRPDGRHIKVSQDQTEGLKITVEGPWFLTIYFEVPLLSMISEIYHENDDINFANCEEGWTKLKNKCDIAKQSGFTFADFGTRRRASHSWQNNLLTYIKHSGIKGFAGTSNVYFAKKFGLKPIGTMAHEFFQIHQAICGSLINFQKMALQSWANEYRGDLGIALTDTIGINAFLRDFDLYFAKLYDGLRHDSGSPYDWAHKALWHYQKLGINPKTKTLVFSDGLNFEKCAHIHDAYKESINVSFGIGTCLTNDFDDYKPLQIVMKIVECNGRPVAKISDSPGKGMCKDEEYVSYLRKVFGVEQ